MFTNRWLFFDEIEWDFYKSVIIFRRNWMTFLQIGDYFSTNLNENCFWVATQSRQMKPQTIDCFRQQKKLKNWKIIFRHPRKKMLNWKFSFPILRPWLNPVSCLSNANQMLMLKRKKWDVRTNLFYSIFDVVKSAVRKIFIK